MAAVKVNELSTLEIRVRGQSDLVNTIILCEKCLYFETSFTQCNKTDRVRK